MAIQPIRKQVAPEIPDKLYFRIGDVARLCEVPAYVLRFWETEFPQLKPNKGGTGQRLYRKRDVEMALRIKSLLYDQGYTIPGARQVFKNDAKLRDPAAPETGGAPPSSVHLPETIATGHATAAVAQELMAPAPAAAVEEEAGAQFRRQARLRALQSELKSLLQLLEQPRADGGSRPAAARPQAMRPRLVAEPRTEHRLAPVRVEKLRLVLEPSGEEKDQRDARDQGDLFSGE